MTEETNGAIETKLVDMLDALQSGAVKVGEQIVRYSPDVADAALWVIRIDGVQELLIGFIALVAVVWTSKYLIRLWRWTIRHFYESEGLTILPAAFGSLLFFFVICFAANKLLDVWNWVAVFEPKLWLAKQIVDNALK